MNSETNTTSNLLVSTDQSLLNLKLITDFLTQTYWGKDMQPAQIRKAIKNSICFGLYDNQNQVGFARVVTDHIFFAWLADVFVIPFCQGKGYGQFLLNKILNHPQLVDVKRWRLATKDAHAFYSKFGFTKTGNHDRLMEK